jgi:hypothetical protein
MGGEVLNVLSGAAFLFSSTGLALRDREGRADGRHAGDGGRVRSAPHPRERALPGTVDTDMVRRNPAEAQAEMTKIQLMPRMPHPDETVGPTLMLTSDAGSFITGHVVFADGGMVPR